MPKCSNCAREIDYLIEGCEVIEFYQVRLGSNGLSFDYEPAQGDSSESTGKEPDYSCPECLAILFEDAEDAIEFLKGE